MRSCHIGIATSFIIRKFIGKLITQNDLYDIAFEKKYDFNIEQTIILRFSQSINTKDNYSKINESTRQYIDDVMTLSYKNRKFNVIYNLFHLIITYTNIFII